MKKEKEYIIGIDIGGTKMSAVLFDGSKVIADYKLATPHDTVKHVIIMIEALIEPLLDKAKKDKADVRGIGIAVAGIVDFKKQIIAKNSPNLELLDKIKLAELVEEKKGIKTIMDNDANCFVRAESLLGAGKKHNSVYGLTIGTGIGGGWSLGKEIFYGSHGGANEPGRFIMDVKEKIDIEIIYQRLTQHNLFKIAQEAYKGDVLAERIFEELGETLGVFLANAVNLIDPEIFVVGGGALEVCDLFLPKARKVMREHIMNPDSKKIKVEKSKLGDNAGSIGAALLITLNYETKFRKPNREAIKNI